MKEIVLSEVLPELNARGVMGRVVVPLASKDLKATDYGKIYMCCKRAFLTLASFQQHQDTVHCAPKNSTKLSVKGERKILSAVSSTNAFSRRLARNVDAEKAKEQPSSVSLARSPPGREHSAKKEITTENRDNAKEFLNESPKATRYHFCKFCDYRTSRYKKWNLHLKTYHAKNGLQCPECCFRIRHMEGLRNHVRKMHNRKLNKDDYVLKCQDCKFETYYTKLLNHHVRTAHVEGKQTNYSEEARICHICNFSYTNRLESHILRAHVPGGYECPEGCGCSFETRVGVAKHLIKRHGQKHLERKKQSHNAGEFVEKCELCDFRSKTKQGLNIHCKLIHKFSISLHSETKACDICGSECIGESVRPHKQRCHVKAGFKCAFCTLSFATNHGRSIHCEASHRYRDKNPSRCRECGLPPCRESGQPGHDDNSYSRTTSYCKCSFQEIAKNDNHSMSVFFPKETCLICNQVLEISLQKHRRQLHVKNGYKCSLCPCSFRTAVGRKTHVAKMHKKVARRPAKASGSSCVCNLCGLEILEPEDEHLIRCHSSSNVYQCSHCSCRFRSEGGLKYHTSVRHKPVHQEVGGNVSKLPPNCHKTKCASCNLQVDNLDDHQRKNHVKNGLPCFHCPCSFSTEKGRLVHIQLVHSLGRLDDSERKEDKNRHYPDIKIHESIIGDGVFKPITPKEALICPKCGYLATCMSHLNIHLMKSHVQNSEFPCRQCSCGYATESELLRHTKLMHPEPIYIVKELTRIFVK